MTHHITQHVAPSVSHDLSFITVRDDGVLRLTREPFRQHISATIGYVPQFLEMPSSRGENAHDFINNFFEAVTRSTGSWLYFCPRSAVVIPEPFTATLNALRTSGEAGLLGAFLAPIVKQPDGSTQPLLPEGFSPEALESSLSACRALNDPECILSSFILHRSVAETLAATLLQMIDPLPEIIACMIITQLHRASQGGNLYNATAAAVLLTPGRTQEELFAEANALILADSYTEGLEILNRMRFLFGPKPEYELLRAMAMLHRKEVWLIDRIVYGALKQVPDDNNEINIAYRRVGAYADKLRDSSERGYRAAQSLLDMVAPLDPSSGEEKLFNLVSDLPPHASLISLGEFPLRSSLIMGLASAGTYKNVSTISPFRMNIGWQALVGNGHDLWRSAVSRYELERNMMAYSDSAAYQTSRGNGAPVDFVHCTSVSNASQVTWAFDTLSEGGIFAVEGVGPEHPDNWRFWLEKVEPALAECGNSGSLRWGRKTAVALGGKKRSVNLSELWRRSRLPEPYERTMLNVERFRNAFALARKIEIRQVPGAIVECGVWRGGGSAAMKLALEEVGSTRNLWAFDSFEGLPLPGDKDGAFAHKKSAEWKGSGCNATEEEFHYTIQTVAELSGKNLHVRKGWFKDTVPVARGEIGPIAILRLDGDWYESVLECLNYLYDQVSIGGYILIDDYGYWEGAKRATDEFRANRGITSPLLSNEASERYWIKLR